MLQWTIEQARQASSVDAVYVSSDGDEILEFAAAAGATPVRRPPDLSGDHASSESALRHALGEVGDGVETVVFLQATSPLRLPGDIDGAVETLREQGADSVFAASRMRNFMWERNGTDLASVNYDFRNRTRRQDHSGETWVETGSIYVFRPEALLAHDNRLSGKIAMHELQAWQAFEVDEHEDVAFCEALFTALVLPALADR